MGRAIELLTGTVVAPGATITATTPASGNSYTIRNARADSVVYLLQAWVYSHASGVLRIRSPQLHDNVQGIRVRHVAGEVDPLLPSDVLQQLKPQDTLAVELSGSATAGDIETACLLVYYEDLPGIEGRFISVDELKDRAKHIVTVENTLSFGTSGGYSGDETLKSEFDLLKANRDYAILGFHVSAPCACVRYRSSDFGNLGLGGPGNNKDKEITGEWFVRMSRIAGVPLIPVFNSANAGAIFVDGAQNEDATSVTVTTILAELGS